MLWFNPMGSGWNVKVPKGPSIKCVRKIFQKTITIISHPPPPLIRTFTCVYQGIRNVSFSENVAYVLNGWPLRHSEDFQDVF